MNSFFVRSEGESTPLDCHTLGLLHSLIHADSFPIGLIKQLWRNIFTMLLQTK